MKEQLYNNVNNEDWTVLGSPIYKKAYDDVLPNKPDDEIINENEDTRKQRTRFLSPVITLQLAVSLIVLILSYLSNALISDKFENAKYTFEKELYSSMFFDGDFESKDYSSLFRFDE